MRMSRASAAWRALHMAGRAQDSHTTCCTGLGPQGGWPALSALCWSPKQACSPAPGCGPVLLSATLPEGWQVPRGKHHRSRQQGCRLPSGRHNSLLISAQPSRPADSSANRKRYYYAAQLDMLFIARHYHLSRMVDRQPDEQEGLELLRLGTS